LPQALANVMRFGASALDLFASEVRHFGERSAPTRLGRTGSLSDGDDAIAGILRHFGHSRLRDWQVIRQDEKL
jgi:hypothetical protein